MTKAKDLARLRAVMDMARDADLQKLSQVAERIARLRAEVDRLRADQAQRARDGALDVARFSGADVAWLGWTEDRLRSLQSRIAALEMERIELRRLAQRSTGRADVAARLADEHDKPRGR
ncbi:hypothetical protein [Tranquillimonas rosea]|uniref:hypothetical protein n=1 Tax=Tranquillimonas rosea TaxID=641238 RepID=UPI003BAC1289